MPKVSFQRLTLVRLVTPETPAPDTAEDDAIQTAHIRYLGDLAARGIIVLNGPILRRDDPSFRGLSIYTVAPEEALEYAKNDPAAKAGWFEFIVDEWLIRAEPKVIGNKADLELDVPDG